MHGRSWRERSLLPPTGSSWIAVALAFPPVVLPHGPVTPGGEADRGSRRMGEPGATAGMPGCCRGSRTGSWMATLSTGC
jgi:hypothetical protein